MLGLIKDLNRLHHGYFSDNRTASFVSILDGLDGQDCHSNALL